MKTIELAIRNAEILEEMNKMTSYTGAKSESNAADALYDRVVTVGKDSDILNRYRDMASSELAERLKEFLVCIDSNGEEVKLTLNVSGSYDDSLTPSLRTDFFTFMTSSMASRWFRLTLEAKSKEYAEEAQRSLGDAVKKLFHRKKPKRRVEQKDRRTEEHKDRLS